ncbi:dihydropteroate synthase [Thiotrichales bacterium 19S11-10]|nr:dihydropteroate synthase [Thiotrichales bacterium 19S11-10]
MSQYVLGLGSNLNNPLVELRKAVNLLKAYQLEIKAYSSIYCSEAVVPEDSPISWDLPFLNAAVLVNTDLSPEELLRTIKEIETDMGRAVDHETWSPRIIDIDILCSGYLSLNTDDGLTIPHAELLERSFALKPLLDVLPNWRHPNEIELDLVAHAESLNPVIKIKQLLFGPEIMGILNITPNSFSDGGQFESIDDAIKQFHQLIEEGAHIIDIGAESTSLDALKNPIHRDTEWQRLEPMLDYLQQEYPRLPVKPIISVDTHRYETMQKLVNYDFVTIINDVTGSDIYLKADLLKSNPYLQYIIMDNWRGPLADIGAHLDSDFDRVMAFAEEQIATLLAQGVKRSQIIFDPGYGFAKPSDTVRGLTNCIEQMKARLEVPILIGHSRKKSVVNPMKLVDLDMEDSMDLETSILSFHFIKKGADILRVHQVGFSRRASIISNFYH